ncbi:unnamed protein product [Caenorhabditis nigoni]
MNVYSVFVFAVLAVSSVSGIINIGGGGKKCGGGGNGYGSGIIIGAPKPGGNRVISEEGYGIYDPALYRYFDE